MFNIQKVGKLIQKIEYSDIPEQILNSKDAKRNYVTFSKSAKYLGYFIDKKLVGVVGYKNYSASSLLLSDYVLSEFRSLGIYDKLFKERLKFITIPCYAHSTNYSINTMLRYDFKVIKTFKTNYKLEYYGKLGV